jgi:hypothetical protein
MHGQPIINILMGINNFNAAWEKLSVNCLNGMWRKLLSRFMHDITGSEQRTIMLTTSAGVRNRRD